MLILTRKTNQKIVIGENIEITIIEMREGHVKLGIKAPHDVAVFRKELYREVQDENINATINMPIESPFNKTPLKKADSKR